MVPWLKQFPARINNAVGAAANWAVLGGLFGGGALMTWAANSITALAEHGWGAVAFAAGAMTCLIAFAARALLPILVYFRPPALPGPEASPTAAPLQSNNYAFPLSEGLYIGEIRMSFGELQENRHAQITIRVFNGTGRTVVFSRLGGNITFRGADTQGADRFRGSLPTPSLRADTDLTAPPLQEWFIILSQRADAAAADKIISMIHDDVTILFDMVSLTIEVFDKNAPETIERLPLWGGFSYKKEHGFGRIITASMNAKLG